MNVLILTDFSEVSKNASQYAVDFLKNSRVNFHLLNIGEFNFQPSAKKQWNTQLVSTLEKLQHSVKELEDYSNDPKHSFHTRLSSDKLIDSVRVTLSEKKIDLIFIGAVSNDEHAHPILGDHAYDVVRKIKCNIVVVPGNCKYRSPEKIIFPIDHSVFELGDIDHIYESLDYLQPSEIKLMEIGRKAATLRDNLEDGLVDFNSEIFRNIQRKFDMVFVLGKNLNICDRLLHKDHGISTAMKMEIPIFVYHG